MHSQALAAASGTNVSSDRSGGMPRLPWGLLALLMGLGLVTPVQAATWDRIAHFLQRIQATGVEALVANDCPPGLLGAFHDRRQVLLLCGNNLPDDPEPVWVVLAHEAAHVMQSCKGGPLLPPDLLGAGMRSARLQQPDAFQDLNLYQTHLHHVEAEARLVQAMPPEQVQALFETHCAARLEP